MLAMQCLAFKVKRVDMHKNILITGAGGGFGKLVTLNFAKRGHRVAASTYDQDQADALTVDASNLACTIKIIKLDITSELDRLQVTGNK